MNKQTYEIRRDVLRKTMLILFGSTVMAIIISGTFTFLNSYNDVARTSENMVKTVSQYLQMNNTLIMEKEKIIEPKITGVLSSLAHRYAQNNGVVSQSELKSLINGFDGNVDLYIIDKNGVIRESTYKNDIGLDLMKIEAGSSNLRHARSLGYEKTYVSELTSSDVEKLVTIYYYYPLRNGEFLEASLRIDNSFYTLFNGTSIFPI